MRNTLFIGVLCFFTSCVVQKEQVGNYNNQEGKSIVHEKGKDFYLFWENISVRKVEDKIEVEDYEKIVRRSFFDNVVFYGTIGIFSFYTVEIKTKEVKKE